MEHTGMVYRSGMNDLVKIGVTTQGIIEELKKRRRSEQQEHNDWPSSSETGKPTTVPKAMPVCSGCGNLLRPDRRHCPGCHQDLKEGVHGWVGKEPDRMDAMLFPRELVPCP